MYSLIDKISDLLNTVITILKNEITTKINSVNTTVTNGFNKGCVKSVQRGKYSNSSSSSTKPVTISISSVNTSKSIILINGDSSYYNTGDSSFQLMVSSFSSTSFTIEVKTGYLTCFSWQVIEFY